MSPDPRKVEALQSVAPPTNVSELRSLLSSAAFCSRFIKDFAIITRPLRQLTCDGKSWQLTREEQSSFIRLKEALSVKQSLDTSTPRNPTSSFVDGSQVTKVITDHIPLVTLFNNPSSKPSARIERWLMELQQYRFTVEYPPGASNPADYASRHPVRDPESHNYEVDLRNTFLSLQGMHAVIPKLDQLFATFGTPHIVKSDNGPPFFHGEEFAKFAGVLGFRHRKVTPPWPRANEEVERFVKKLKKCIKAAKAEGRNWRKELQAILRHYRTTPHATTGVAPAVLLLKRPVRKKLPQDNHVDPVSEIISERNSSQKSKIKLHAEKRTYVKPCTISPGQTVLVKRPFFVSKVGTVYEPIP
ncbi:uncharacterized protein [Montipora foliosa]|uniref:uncharacterized protein n=1 Tax=Montipora foliosa TaxID=591990 RepID=UPI0035F1E502